MPTLHIDKTQSIYYLESNPEARSNVLLLHGLGANSSSWQYQIPALCEVGYRVIAPDTPGFGQSPFQARNVNLSDVSNIYYSFLNEFGISQTDIVGISMGGVLALQIAIEYPRLIRRIVLVNTFAKLNTQNLRVLPYLIKRAVFLYTLGLPYQAQVVADQLFPNADQRYFRDELISQICQSNPRAYRGYMLALARFDVTKRLSEIDKPTLVVTGERDTTVPIDIQSKLAEGIPGARHEMLDCGHALTVEKPQDFNKILINFLSSPSLSY
jgi:3-oxoadipate enol-lactonase